MLTMKAETIVLIMIKCAYEQALMIQLDSLCVDLGFNFPTGYLSKKKKKKFFLSNWLNPENWSILICSSLSFVSVSGHLQSTLLGVHLPNWHLKQTLFESNQYSWNWKIWYV